MVVAAAARGSSCRLCLVVDVDEDEDDDVASMPAAAAAAVSAAVSQHLPAQAKAVGPDPTLP